jgi:hypothetical protein
MGCSCHIDPPCNYCTELYECMGWELIQTTKVPGSYMTCLVWNYYQANQAFNCLFAPSPILCLDANKMTMRYCNSLMEAKEFYEETI